MKKWIFSSLSMICLVVALMGTSCNFTPSADTVTAVKQEQSLEDAVTACLQLNRDRVYKGSLRWTWEKAWEIFRDNLIPAK